MENQVAEALATIQELTKVNLEMAAELEKREAQLQGLFPELERLTLLEKCSASKVKGLEAEVDRLNKRIVTISNFRKRMEPFIYGDRR